MNFTAMASDSSCAVAFSAQGTEDAIRKLSILSAPNAPELSAEEIFGRLLSRERAISTAYDHGVALPHCRADEVTRFSLALAISPQGVRFRADSDDLTYIFLALVGPADQPDQYIHVLSLLAQFALDPGARQQLLAAKTPRQVRSVFSLYPHRDDSGERYMPGD